MHGSRAGIGFDLEQLKQFLIVRFSGSKGFKIRLLVFILTTRCIFCKNFIKFFRLIINEIAQYDL